MSYDACGKLSFGDDYDEAKPLIVVPHYWLSGACGPADFASPAALKVCEFAKNHPACVTLEGDVYAGIMITVDGTVDEAKAVAVELFESCLKDFEVERPECGMGCVDDGVECCCFDDFLPFRVCVCERADDGQPAWGINLEGQIVDDPFG